MTPVARTAAGACARAALSAVACGRCRRRRFRTAAQYGMSRAASASATRTSACARAGAQCSGSSRMPCRARTCIRGLVSAARTKRGGTYDSETMALCDS